LGRWWGGRSVVWLLGDRLGDCGDDVVDDHHVDLNHVNVDDDEIYIVDSDGAIVNWCGPRGRNRVVPYSRNGLAIIAR
jgi:hypothetical protein